MEKAGVFIENICTLMIPNVFFPLFLELITSVCCFVFSAAKMQPQTLNNEREKRNRAVLSRPLIPFRSNLLEIGEEGGG